MACVGVCILRCLKVEVAWDTEKQLQVIRLLFKTIIPLGN